MVTTNRLGPDPNPRHYSFDGLVLQGPFGRIKIDEFYIRRSAPLFWKGGEGDRAIEVHVPQEFYFENPSQGAWKITKDEKPVISDLYVVDWAKGTGRIVLIGKADADLIQFELEMIALEKEESKHPGLVRMRLMVQEDK